MYTCTRAFLTITVSHADLWIFSDGDMDTDEPDSGNGWENPYGGKLT